MIWAVFCWEMLQAGRRRRAYFLRWLYATVVLVQIAPLLFRSQMGWGWLLSVMAAWDRHVSLSSAFTFFESFLTQHYLLLVLLTPAMVGGAITEEKTRGTLEHLLTACFRPGEIILGKLLAHGYQLVLWSLLGLPLFCYFAGIARDASLPVMVAASSTALALGIAAVAILMSVCCRSTRAAVFGTYFLIALVIVLIPTLAASSWGPGFLLLNPLRVFSLDDGFLRWQQLPHVFPRLSLEDRSLRWPRLAAHLGAWFALTCACLVTASWQLRRAYRRQLEIRGRRGIGGWLATFGRLRGNPVLWREQGVVSIAALDKRNWRTPWLGLAGVVAASVGTLYLLLRSLPSSHDPWHLILQGRWDTLLGILRPTAGEVFFWQGLAALVLVSLMAAIRASGSVTGEKEKGTWLALMVTPLSTPEVIAGKMRGIFWDCLPYVAAHASVTLPLALLLGYWPIVWTILWALVMVLAVSWCGAVGLWCSARSTSSWRSLLATLTFSYCGAIVLFWRPLALPVYAGPLPIILGGALGAGCALWAKMFWRRLVAMFTVFYFAWFVFFWPFGLFAGVTRPTVMKEEPGGRLADFASAFSWSFWFWVASAFWYSIRYLVTSAAARVGRADRWEMGLERDVPNERKLEEKWQAPRFNDIREEAAVLTSEDSQSSQMLLAIKSHQIEEGASAETRGDKRMTVRHFLAAAHLELVLAEEYESRARYELAVETRKSAACCFWRAGDVAKARSLFEELRRGNRFLAREIDEVVRELERSHSGSFPQGMT
jgi:ABC-type transport system involved in multi-copper enzyme maturation permease subunit